MTPEHSNIGRLTASEAEPGSGCAYVTAGHRALARVHNLDLGGRSDADARRLAAAWNFCNGIPTEDLERHGDVAGFVSSKTMLTGIAPGNGSVDIGFEGGACAILASSFAEQFVNAGATNYLELRFSHDATGPLLVTVQRAQGLTPAQLRAKAEQQRDEALATLEAVLKHFTRVPSTLADTTARSDAHAVIQRIRGES